MNAKPTLLITGASSHMARPLVNHLRLHYDIIGVDLREHSKGWRFPGQFYCLDYTKRSFVEIYRQHSIHAVIHLGRIKPTRPIGSGYRFKKNVLGCKAILEHGYEHGVRKFIVLSSHQVYGAFKENYLYLKEEESLKAGSRVPELSDTVEMDHQAREFMWRHPKTQTVVLRPTNIIGPHMDGVLMRALRSKISPVLIGFDPLLQFIHERDVVEAISLALGSEAKGVFNITGEGLIPYSDALEKAGSKPFPMLKCAFPAIFKAIGYKMPAHFVDHLKYPIVVSDDKFRSRFGFQPSLSLEQCLRQLS